MIEYNRLNIKTKYERETLLKKYHLNELSEIDKISLHTLNLSMYSDFSNYQIKLEEYLFKSKFDSNVTLHPEQIECLDILRKGDNLLLSAPTSFGKTYLVLEYILRYKESLENILFIVPTISLRNELYKKIRKSFSNDYNIIINNFEEEKKKNIYLLLPERMEESEFIEKIRKKNFDLCIIDEVYKLGTQNDDTRNIIFNKAYYQMTMNAKQLILLGPFMKNVSFNNNKDILQFTKYYSNFSPVYNEVILSDSSSTSLLENVIGRNAEAKQIIFSPSPKKISKLIDELDLINHTEDSTNEYINFLEKQYFAEWNLIKMLKNKMLYHCGPLPKYIRDYIEDLYNDKDSGYNVILATSTLLEGINTPTNIMHIYDIKYTNSRSLNKFEINNLIGRVGRLSEMKKGKIYIYDKQIYSMVDGNYNEEITFTAEDDNYKSYEDAIDLGIKVNSREEKEYKKNVAQVRKDIEKTKDIKLDETLINLKYYRRFLESKEILIDNVNSKDTDFKKILAILNFYSNEIMKTRGKQTYIALRILMHKADIKSFLSEDIDKDERILDYFKAINYIEYDLGALIELLKLDSLSDVAYKKQAVKLIRIYTIHVTKSETYKTLIDLGFSDYDAYRIDLRLKEYTFKNSQELIKEIVKIKEELVLSPFGKRTITNFN